MLTRTFDRNPPMNSKISVIIPSYNERNNVSPLVKRIDRALSNYDYSILFVDDDSSDGTAHLAQALSSKFPIQVLVRRDKRGLASAVTDGLENTAGQIIVVMDADLQHPPELIPELLMKMDDGADLAIASRYVEEGNCEGWGIIRRIISKGAILIAHLLLPPTSKIQDPMSGFFTFRRRALADVKLQPIGYKILLEMLVLGSFHKVVEVPYTFRNRSSGESKLGTKIQINYLQHIFSLMKRTSELQRVFKFILVGLSGVFVNMGLLWALTQSAGLQLQAASAIAIESSIISNFFFNNYFTFRDRRSPAWKITLRRLLKFNMVSLVGLAINLGILTLLTTVFGIYYLLANLIGIVVAALWNYLLSTSWTWRQQD